jgi:hypothetical protein
MSIFHAKVSGNANTTPDDVGGEDWDHHHLHGVGGMFAHGFVRTYAAPDPDGVDTESAYCFGAITGLVYNSEDHRLTVTINPDGLPIVPGGVPDFYILWRKESPVWCPETLVFNSSSTNGSGQVVSLTYDIRPILSANAQFSQVVELVGILYVMVG